MQGKQPIGMILKRNERIVQVKITPKAKADIKSIYKYILFDSYQNAEMVSEAIIRKIDSLKRQADLGKIVK